MAKAAAEPCGMPTEETTTSVTNDASAGDKPRKYTIVKSFREGHVFLRENATGRIAVGDQSGYIYGDRRYFIEGTDDGILWLDVTRPVTLIKRPGRYNPRLGGYLVSIPLLQPNGKATNTIGTDTEASFCHAIAGMDVIGQGATFEAEIHAIKKGRLTFK